ncbi:hypothetical protein SCLCIDRAFT_1222550 [Scleroderma citrinum Foug A]|uniref:HIG1 domain-containing protein n=1 Tax=Scleroderma citrinum Foug A TaxID=1036808 RepID=A0A0C3CYW9_9AGAM|nr:hypothetical protein SCLCIDRAFT_1222550 [Scleroderma citrinum Foug A]
MKEKFADRTARHKLSFIVGSWAISMTAAGATIMHDPYQPVRHKVVQARVWAQWLTLGDISATGALTHSHCAKGAQMRETCIPGHTAWW